MACAAVVRAPSRDHTCSHHTRSPSPVAHCPRGPVPDSGRRRAVLRRAAADARARGCRRVAAPPGLYEAAGKRRHGAAAGRVPPGCGRAAHRCAALRAAPAGGWGQPAAADGPVLQGGSAGGRGAAGGHAGSGAPGCKRAQACHALRNTHPSPHHPVCTPCPPPPAFRKVLDKAGIQDPFIRNWLDLLAFLLSGLPADGTIAGARTGQGGGDSAIAGTAQGDCPSGSPGD